MNERLYTVKELAELLRVHPATVTRALVSGAIKGFRPLSKLGGRSHWRIGQAEVNRLMGGVLEVGNGKE